MELQTKGLGSVRLSNDASYQLVHLKTDDGEAHRTVRTPDDHGRPQLGKYARPYLTDVVPPQHRPNAVS